VLLDHVQCSVPYSKVSIWKQMFGVFLSINYKKIIVRVYNGEAVFIISGDIKHANE